MKKNYFCLFSYNSIRRFAPSTCDSNILIRFIKSPSAVLTAKPVQKMSFHDHLSLLHLYHNLYGMEVVTDTGRNSSSNSFGRDILATSLNFPSWAIFNKKGLLRSTFITSAGCSIPNFFSSNPELFAAT